MASFKELQEQITRLQGEATIARKAELKQAIAEIREKMAAFDITIEDLGDGAGKSAKGKTARPAVVAKYRDPESGKTWSGRGRAPLWIQGDAKKYLIG